MERPRGRGDGAAGQVFTWLAAGALALNLLLIVGLLFVLASNGLGSFWQGRLLELVLDDGSRVLGEPAGREEIPGGAPATRIRLKTGNRDLLGADFRWLEEASVVSRSYPSEAVLLERTEWGDFLGYLEELRDLEGRVVTGGVMWERLPAFLDHKREQRRTIRALEGGPISDVSYRMERLRLQLRGLALGDPEPAERERLERELAVQRDRYQLLVRELEALRAEFLDARLVARSADGARIEMPVGLVLRVLRPNAMSGLQRVALYLERIGEFIVAEPRESNTEGGVFPAIFGTVMMVLLMSIAVVPLGVLAAVYMHEYAREGLLLRTLRISVHNLAGVPSIVFGVFGLGFFVYLVGGSLDQLFYPEALPAPTFGTGGILWASLTLALLTVPVVIVATEEGLSAVPRAVREGSLALGATRFETIRRVVLPAASPGILTGVILAVGRAAGEVAPLMIVGMVKLAPSLPIDHQFPYLHLERKFMHLGFHIYDLAFQSPNIEATKPLVFATAVLLVAVVLATNLAAIVLRARLRRRGASSAV